MNAEQLAELIAAVRAPASDGKRLSPFVTGDPVDWTAWKQNFENVITLKGWTNAQARAQLKAAMEGVACRMVHDIVVTDQHTYQEVLVLYGNRFLPPAASRLARSDFKKAKQTNSETITQWHTRLRELYTRAHPNQDTDTSVELIECFLLGLAHQQVRFLANLDLPQTYSLALNSATDKLASLHNMKSHDGLGGRNVSGGINALGAEYGTEPTHPALNAMHEEGCWNCDAKDHFKRECPKPPRRFPSSGRRPFSGGRGRHSRGGLFPSRRRGGTPSAPPRKPNNFAIASIAGAITDAFAGINFSEDQNASGN
jgi:hypothetical protein